MKTSFVFVFLARRRRLASFVAAASAFLALAPASWSQNSQSRLNKPAPKLVFGKVINSPKPTLAVADLKSKIVILDFWATWCSPCIASLPHLEALQNKYRDRVQVVTITDESEDRIRLFLAKKKLGLPVVLDSEHKLAALFPFNTLPHTIVIDEKNIVRAITDSSKITDKVIDKLLAKQAVRIEEKRDDLSFDPSKPLSGKENFLFQTTITPFQNGLPSLFNNYEVGSSVYLHRRILAVNVGLKELYEIAYQFPTYIRTRVEVKDKAAFKWSEQNAFCYDFIVPEAIGAARFSMMQRNLNMMFPYRATVETRDVPVKILQRIEGAKVQLPAPTGTETQTSMSGKGLSMKNGPVKTIADFMQMVTNKIVLDETGIGGNYDLELPYYLEDPAKTNAELKKIGLETVEATRKIELLIISDQ